MAWAGWKFSGCLHFSLVNFGVSIPLSNAIAMVPYIAFDIFAVLDTAHWTALAYSFIVVEALVLVLSMLGHLKFGAIMNAAYVLAGIALFATGEAPVVTPGTDFFGNTFAMAWAGWKFSGCLHFSLVNFGVSIPLSNAIAMVPYIAFDIFAVLDTAHWTALAYSFIVVEALVLVLSLHEALDTTPPPVKELRRRFMTMMFPGYIGLLRRLLCGVKKLRAKPTDVVIAVPAKSGTTWLMHMAHQLRMEGAEPRFGDQMEVMPWIPPGPADALDQDLNGPQGGLCRVFKSHAPYRQLQYEPAPKLVYCYRDLKVRMIFVFGELLQFQSEFRYQRSCCCCEGRVCVCIQVHELDAWS
eukprot:SAG11_NODE_2828_length_2935_cov_3.086389_3_plen_354_part_00